MDEQKINNGESGVGATIAIIIILAIIVLGGLYFWNQRKAEMNQLDQTQQVAPVTAAEIQAIEKQSTSDSTASIEADLKATDTANVDAALTQ